MKRILILTITVGLLFQVQAQNAKNVLDLTKLTPDTEEVGPNGSVMVQDCVCSVADLNRPPVSPPLRITLSVVGKTKYAVGDEMVYDITLENKSKEPYIIPWSISRSAARPEGKPVNVYRWVLISLFIRVDGQKDIVMGANSLYGSDAGPGTLKTLQPGERATIRSSTRLSVAEWNGSAAYIQSHTSSRPFDLYVAYGVGEQRPDNVTQLPAKSFNDAKITLAR